MKGFTFRRCGCRDEDGKLLTACPRLGRERGHGSWYYRANVGRDAAGKRREQRRGGFTTKAAADAALAKVLASVSTGEHRHDDRQTVATDFAEWIDAKERNGLRPATVAVYRSYLERHRPGARCGPARRAAPWAR